MKILQTHVVFIGSIFVKVYETDNERYFMQDEFEELNEISTKEFKKYNQAAIKNKNNE